MHFDDDPENDFSYRAYAAYASHMDHAVGRLIETIECLCQRERTLVVFTSDNGAPESMPAFSLTDYPGFQPPAPRLGSNLPWRGQKRQLYEGGIRTPTIVNWPGTLAAGRMSRPIHAVDWMPTLCGLTGSAPAHEPHWDGVDVWPLLDPQADAPAPEVEQRAIHWNVRGEQFAVREGPWKLIVREKAGAIPVELFNMDTDARETTNVCEQHPDEVARLREAIATNGRHDGVSARPEVTGPDVDNMITEP
jgi:arylsulfatase A-like enzyme